MFVVGCEIKRMDSLGISYCKLYCLGGEYTRVCKTNEYKIREMLGLGFLQAFVPGLRLLSCYGVPLGLYFPTFRRVVSHNDERNIP